MRSKATERHLDAHGMQAKAIERHLKTHGAQRKARGRHADGILSEALRGSSC